MKSPELLELYKTKLFMAVRDTLETMAFAEVASCDGAMSNAAVSDSSEFSAEAEAWGTSPEAVASDDWGAPTEETSSSDGGWGTSDGEAGAFADAGCDITDPAAKFDELIKTEEDFIWSRVRVECNEIHYIYFVASKSLMESLTDTMYAGDDCPTDIPFYLDTIAELCNTLCGRLMLSLEDKLGMFKLSVPENGEGMPSVPASTLESKVLVDGDHAVLTVIEFIND